MSSDVLAFVLARLREEQTRARDRGDGSPVDLMSSPGHDRSCARAMLSQSRLAPWAQHRLSDIQVRHLIQIGYTRGQNANHESLAVEFALLQRLQVLRAVAARPRWRLARVERRALAEVPGLELAIRLMAVRFSHHRDYREEWRA
jgi:hypothetical protein